MNIMLNMDKDQAQNLSAILESGVEKFTSLYKFSKSKKEKEAIKEAESILNKLKLVVSSKRKYEKKVKRGPGRPPLKKQGKPGRPKKEETPLEQQTPVVITA